MMVKKLWPGSGEAGSGLSPNVMSREEKGVVGALAIMISGSPRRHISDLCTGVSSLPYLLGFSVIRALVCAQGEPRTAVDGTSFATGYGLCQG